MKNKNELKKEDYVITSDNFETNIIYAFQDRNEHPIRVDLNKKFEGYQPGDLIIGGFPFHYLPLELELAIRVDGSIVFRKWNWRNGCGQYFHTDEKELKATPQQIETVSGLWSGRIDYMGIKIAIGGTIQEICPIDVENEEKLKGEKIYLA